MPAAPTVCDEQRSDVAQRFARETRDECGRICSDALRFFFSSELSLFLPAENGFNVPGELSRICNCLTRGPRPRPHS
jgi:hypothetical protein